MAEITVKPSSALGMCKSVMRIVKARGGNAFQSFRYAAHSDYLEPLGLERFAHHVQYNFIVIHQENSMDCLSFD
jgi:hypothetical protein